MHLAFVRDFGQLARLLVHGPGLEVRFNGLLIRALIPILVLFAIASAGIARFVYTATLRSEFASTLDAGAVRLSEASARLRGQLDVFRTLVNVIAQDPRIQAAQSATDIETTNDLLKSFSLTYGAWEVDLIGPDATLRATSHPERDGQRFSQQLIQTALNAQLGYQQDQVGSRRLLRFSRRVDSVDGQPPGIAIVSVDLATLEFEWPIVPEPVIFFDRAKRSVSSNRPYLVGRHFGDETTGARFPLEPRAIRQGQQLWQYHPLGDAPREVLALSRSIPLLELDGMVLLETDDARATARLQSWLALAGTSVIGLIAAVAFQQRRRLALETQHSATLEARVEARTRELKATQNELVEASNLAALGRLSAGISHELNQPLAAILNFAENGKRLLSQKRADAADENLGAIADQVRRMTRIIRNLRAFARQEVAPAEVVDLVEITGSALSACQQDLNRLGVNVLRDLPPHHVRVLGGQIRLEQVIVNLITNAIDAMRDQDIRHLSVSLKERDGQAQVTIKDTGHGIEDPDRVFEPFYTTKELGASKGLGMGLALCYGIVSGFGGQIACKNTEDGAAFTLSLPLAEVS